jgi:hypothetical protein
MERVRRFGRTPPPRCPTRTEPPVNKGMWACFLSNCKCFKPVPAAGAAARAEFLGDYRHPQHGACNSYVQRNHVTIGRPVHTPVLQKCFPDLLARPAYPGLWPLRWPRPPLGSPAARRHGLALPRPRGRPSPGLVHLDLVDRLPRPLDSSQSPFPFATRPGAIIHPANIILYPLRPI